MRAKQDCLLFASNEQPGSEILVARVLIDPEDVNLQPSQCDLRDHAGHQAASTIPDDQLDG